MTSIMDVEAAPQTMEPASKMTRAVKKTHLTWKKV
jgi:hypothetical protein